MRIVIDLQGAQTGSRFRGIGRYSTSLTKAIIRHRGEHEVFIVLSAFLGDTIEEIRAEFQHLLPPENIQVWSAAGHKTAEMTREAFIASLRPDIVHISSLFEGFSDAVVSIGRFDKQTPVSVSLYDLIPLLNPGHYLTPYPVYERYYLQQIEYIKKAAVLLAISNFSKQEGIEYLGKYGQPIVNINTAVDDFFKPIKHTKAQTQKIYDKFGLNRSFILYTGGVDDRKNIPRLIRAYSFLANSIRDSHQLVLAGKVSDDVKLFLKHDAKLADLRSGELIFTGYISDKELVSLYNLCELYVFPSWHEGFGLPALEAMSCGAAVIGSNTTSLPDVIGNKDALFDPFSEESIAHKITEVLSDERLRQSLIKKGLKQAKKFSWDKSAKKAIAAFETVVQKQSKLPKEASEGLVKKLAFVSPLPPEKSGIAGYSAELLPALAAFYDIDVIVNQDQVLEPWIEENCPIRNIEWFLNHAEEYDRVLYHFGNSHFHEHMYPLLKKIPGVVCLHDFYMSGFSRYKELTKEEPYRWTRDLYKAHGYHAVSERYHAPKDEEVMYYYPCNLDVIQPATGVIVHSNYSKQLAMQWFDNRMSESWRVIPLLRERKEIPKNVNLREKCGIPEDGFVVCAFGLIDSTKLNYSLLIAWLSSHLYKDPNCYLIFVGDSPVADTMCELKSALKGRKEFEGRVRITGWTNDDMFHAYLATADIAVQLRTRSRGETSAAVLDCMNYGLPVISNANGSMAELPSDAVYLIDDDFSEEDLIDALESLWQDATKRQALSLKAKETIATKHSPENCAKLYFEAIEAFYQTAATGRQQLITSLAESDQLLTSDYKLKKIARSLAQNMPDKQPEKRFFIDVTATSSHDLKTGIERVARAILLQLIQNPPQGFRVEPVYLSQEGGQWHYRYARAYTLELLDCPQDWIKDEPIEAQFDDVLLGVDLSGHLVVAAEKAGVYQYLRRLGVHITFTIFDLLPAQSPEMFPKGASKAYITWLKSVCRVSDRVVCISQTVANELSEWLLDHKIKRVKPLEVNWFHLGSDMMSTMPSKGLPDTAEQQLALFAAKPSLLMVGTIEPRKGHLQTLEAFEKLWADGQDINLIIVGKEGWKGLKDSERRTIPEITQVLREHPERNKHLFWLEDASDEYLEKIYAASSALIAASEGEGFGLPLIEAAQHQLAIIARDIPVFREVAAEHAFYFSADKAEDLALALQEWLALLASNQQPNSEAMPWLTWEDSVKQLLKIGAW